MRKRYRHSLRWAVPAVVLLGMALATGCDEVTKYRVLSFFFDGVPPPPGMVVAGGELKPSTQPGTGPSTTPASKPGEEAVASIHAPFIRHQCTECHSSEKSFVAATGVEACPKCHPSYYENKPDDWTHGPAAVGKCSMCHKGHKSEYRRLLIKPQPALCFNCHQSSEVLSRPYHAQAAKVPCGTCHDPHSAGNRLLLADSRTYRRRQAFATIQPSPHSAWNKQQCNNCHLAEHSNQLRPDVNNACMACHKGVQDPAVASAPSMPLTALLVKVPLHDPVRRGQCVSCHTPHRSTRPHLIKPTAEQVCYQCHNSKEIQTDAHPPVHRADCLLCHTGHSSPLKHLLKPGIEPTRTRTMGATTIPSAPPRGRP